MATISITQTINDGNLGDGWNNQFEAAKALANFIESAWMLDTAVLTAEGYEVEFKMIVNRSTDGATPATSIDADSADLDERAALEDRVESLLTDSNDVLWSRFCESDEAKPFISAAA